MNNMSSDMYDHSDDSSEEIEVTSTHTYSTPCVTDDSSQDTSESTCENLDRETLLRALDDTAHELSLLYPPDCSKYQSQTDPEKQRLDLMGLIEEILLNMINTVNNNEPPKLTLRNTKLWTNCDYNERLSLKAEKEAVTVDIKFGDKRSRPKYALLIFLLGKIYKLLATKAPCTKRELFYQNCDKIISQDHLDNALNDITCLLHKPLHELNIFATSKGLVYGSLQIITKSGIIDCTKSGGSLIPHDICDIIEFRSNAKFILVVEKDAIFQKLLLDDATKKLGSYIFITGKGFPDINTRHLLKMLWNILTIPIFALVDPDPWGIEIMCVYRFGSLNMSHQADLLAVPSLRWLGIYPSEIEKFYDINETLTPKDKCKLQDILKRPYIICEPLLAKEIRILLDKNYKAEIEGIESTPTYLTNVYIRLKICSSDFL